MLEYRLILNFLSIINMPKISLEKEIIRTNNLKKYENDLYLQIGNDCYIGGVDEVGRGPLAGPVVAACVILPQDNNLLYINDSKKLSAKKREELDLEIRKVAIDIGIGVVDEKTIDEINILQATYLAMQKAIESMQVKPNALLNDAVTIPNINIKQIPIIKGDAKSISIASASIIAKVYRDNLMINMSSKYPYYLFDKNKGYGTKEHIDAIKKYGPCEIHRKSFITKFI